jgi:hypothetical protein
MNLLDMNNQPASLNPNQEPQMQPQGLLNGAGAQGAQQQGGIEIQAMALKALIEQELPNMSPEQVPQRLSQLEQQYPEAMQFLKQAMQQSMAGEQ